MSQQAQNAQERQLALAHDLDMVQSTPRAVNEGKIITTEDKSSKMPKALEPSSKV